MEDKKLLYITAIIIVVIMIIISGVGLFFYIKNTSQPDIPKLPETNTNTNEGTFLPDFPTLPVNPDQPINADNMQRLQKEKEFISSFWKAPEISYAASPASYKIPLEKIKEQVLNYQDFSRKINMEPMLPKLSQNGFIIVNNAINENVNDWENSYRLIKEKELPLFITSDSVVGLYQDTLQILYKEIEEDIFYDSLWHVLRNMYDISKERYEPLFKEKGIESDIATEAARLQLSYLTVALEILRPKEDQIRESIGSDQRYFTPLESSNYSLSIPPYIKNEIYSEIKLINSRTKTAESIVFGYEKSYEIYNIPAYYQTSEKLKNYYLAVTWLHDVLFPLWNKGNDCASCIFDEYDHAINFVASLYISDDLSKNQNLKNSWANIYKSISFFSGLESNLTYINYNNSIKEIFGQDYDLIKLFSADFETIRKRISLLQQKISSYGFSSALSGSNNTKEEAGLRLAGLRLLRRHLFLEKELFDTLSGQEVGPYLNKVTDTMPNPFTSCQIKRAYYRCVPIGLDIFSSLDSKLANKIIHDGNDDQYSNYENILNSFKNELNKFNDNTWHENAYLSLLFSLKNLDGNILNYPGFMQSENWLKKSLNTKLGSSVGFRKETNLEIVGLNEDIGFDKYFPYGYIEPQFEFYSQLLTNTNMITDGFINLQIINDKSKHYKRILNLKRVLERIIEISKKELENKELAYEDYIFINSFYREIKGVTGDVKKENLQNQASFIYEGIEGEKMGMHISGLNHIIAVYPDSSGKLFLAIGPVYNYREGKGSRKNIPWWEADIRQ